MQHGANPSQRTSVTVGYGTTPIDSACYHNHTDIVDLLYEAIKEFPISPESILRKPLTGIRIVDQANENYYQSTIQGVRRDINHGNGDRQRGLGVMDYSFELMIFTLMEGKSDGQAHEECGDSDRRDKESQANSSEELEVKMMLQQQQDKKRQIMTRHEHSMLHDDDKDESTRFNFEGFFDHVAKGNVEPFRSPIEVPSSDQKKSY